MNKGITRFIYMGDPQCSRLHGRKNDYSQWSALLKRALFDGSRNDDSDDERLLILGGDLVNRGDDEAAWEAFFDAEETATKEAGIGKTLMATVTTGSEECIGRYADRFINPGNGPACHEKEFFSFDWGCCHFIFIESDYMGNRRRDAVQYIQNWIMEDLASNGKPVAFAVMHHPVYTMGTAFDDDVRADAIRDNYLELFRSLGVDFILCGHQHVYSRSMESGDGITQVMGVSGTKFFDSWDKRDMDAVREYVSVATLFETDGETINLKTIDKDGKVLDEYTQRARPIEARLANSAAESAAEAGVRGETDPLKPSNEEGISVSFSDEAESEILFTDEDLERFEVVEVEYSVMRRGRLRYERKRGFRLSDLLAAAAERAKASYAAGTVLILTNGGGRQKVLPFNEVMRAWRYETEEDWSSIPAIITDEEGSYRLYFGQQTAGHYNGRGWMRDVRQIQLRTL